MGWGKIFVKYLASGTQVKNKRMYPNLQRTPKI